jgi:hypothetical protein
MSRAARTVLALLAATTALPLAAQEGPQPILGEGETIEVETHADFNSDGIPDLAWIARGADKRELRVVTSYRSEFDFGENTPQVLPLDPYPLGAGELVVSKGVLVFNDLTGGTSAVASTHRFRWDAKLAAMRLIGLDAKLYSRTWAHDGAEASWNLLTGTLVTHTLKLTGSGDNKSYAKSAEKRTKRASAPLLLEGAPSGEDLLGWPGGQ